MKLVQEPPALITTLNQRLNEQALVLLTDCESLLKEQTLSGQQRVTIAPDNYYVVMQGNLFCGRGGKRFFIFDEGDFIPSSFSQDPFTLETDFAVKIACITEAEFLKRPELYSKLNRYLQSQTLYFCLCAEEAMGAEDQLNPVFLDFEPKQTILTQGEAGDDVFTLLDGLAEVQVDGVTVGTIAVDEIFGAIAALTGTKRTASVIAKERCIVLSLNKERFLGLMKTRPATVLKMVEDMAKSVVSLNQKVVDFTRNRY